MDPTRLTEWLKQPQRVLWGFAIVVALMLWGPDWFIDGLGLEKFIDEYRGFIGVAFLFFLVAALTNTLHRLVQHALKKRQKRKLRVDAERRLHDLTDEEKNVLRGYIHKGSRTQYLWVSDGVALGLVSACVISQAPEGSTTSRRRAHNIQQWAWDYLREHPELLE